MRTSDDPKLLSASFVDDLKGGGVRLECEFGCGFVFDSYEKVDEPCFCPNCKVELFYRSWASW